MDINEALELKIGDLVFYPEDRGYRPGRSKITFIGSTVQKNFFGKEYIWVTLQSGGVWPSNRLSKA